jgi:DNA mismatch endonuclease (patch repair protein)
MQGNTGRDTQPEARLRSLLHRQGLRFRKHTNPLAELRCQADVIFRRARVAVFLDGCFWHGCPVHGRTPRLNSEFWSAKIERNRKRDDRNSAALEAAGWVVLRYWEHDDLEKAADEIAAVCARRAFGSSAGDRGRSTEDGVAQLSRSAELPQDPSGF